MDECSCKINKRKVTNVQEFTITEEIFCEAVRKRKNCSALGLDGIQNFWWKELRGLWKAVVMCCKRWVEQPDTIPEWVTEGRAILLPKSEDLCSKRNYRPVTCLNTCYKLFTSMIATIVAKIVGTNCRFSHFSIPSFPPPPYNVVLL